MQAFGCLLISVLLASYVIHWYDAMQLNFPPVECCLSLLLSLINCFIETQDLLGNLEMQSMADTLERLRSKLMDI